MKLTREEVLKLARLSRLHLTDKEVEMYQNDISAVIDYVTQLEGVDVSGLIPTYQVTGLTSQDKNATRNDEVLPQVSQEELLKNVPKIEGGQIKVKRMIS
jgi:aspartyl-tRNA(Asn)/glutamyl-tRNA(Gln) amidotransferase subunit C